MTWSGQKRTTTLSGLIIIFLVFLLVVTVFFSTPVTEHNKGFDSDGLVYGAMAGADFKNPRLTRYAQHCYRILTPYLASLLPWSILNNFLFLAFWSNVLALIFLMLVLRSLNFSNDLCLIGVLLYGGIFWTLKFSFYSPAYIDYQTQMFLLLIIYLTVSKRYFMLLPVFILSALQREALTAYALFSAVHFFTRRGRPLSMFSCLYLLSIFVIPFGVIALVRSLISAANTHSPLIMLQHMSECLEFRFLPVFCQAVFSGLGLLPVILILQHGPWLRFLRTHKEWIVYLLISLLFLFGGSDKARLFLYALPLVVLLSLHVIRELRDTAAGSRFLPWAFLTLLIHWFMGGYLTSMGSFSDYLARMVPVHSQGNFKPFLIRNLLLALFFFVCTVQFLIRNWYFRPSVGFSRRNVSQDKQ